MSNIIVCKGCGQGYESPLPFFVEMKTCSECTFNNSFKQAKVTEFKDRIVTTFPICPEYEAGPIDITYTLGTGTIICRQWKKCPRRMSKECLEKHMDGRMPIEKRIEFVKSIRRRNAIQGLIMHVIFHKVMK